MEKGARILADITSLSSILIDTSSLIYAKKAGFFKPLFQSLSVFTIPEVRKEAGFDFPATMIAPPLPSHSTDADLIAVSRSHNLPLVTDDKKIILVCIKEGLPVYNAFLMLLRLYSTESLNHSSYLICKEKLLSVTRYSEQIITQCRKIEYLIRTSYS